MQKLQKLQKGGGGGLSAVSAVAALLHQETRFPAARCRVRSATVVDGELPQPHATRPSRHQRLHLPNEVAHIKMRANHRLRFLDTTVALVVQSASGAIQFPGTGAEKGDSGQGDSMGSLLILANLGALIATIAFIYGSERRWVSTGYAALGFVMVVLMGLASVFVFAGDGDVAAINNRLDTIGNGIQLAAPIAAALGAGLFGGRRKPQP